MKKKISSILLIGALVMGTLTGCGGNSSSSSAAKGSYENVELTMTVNGTDIQIDNRVAQKFAELVEEESGGNVKIHVYPNDQLAGGNATKGVEMISEGSVDLAAYASSVMSALDEKLLVGTIPWSFDNYTDARETIDSTGGKYYESVLKEQGITFLGSFHNGFRQLTNSKRTVKTPEDLKGLKIRVPGGEVFLGVFRAFGADPVAMSWSEVFTAIQQGTIDGQENGVNITDTAKMYEVQKYLTIWNYTYENDLFVANSAVWDALDTATQDMLREKAVEACNWGRDILEQEEEEIVTKFEDYGMEVTRLSEEELAPFKAVVSDLRTSLMKKYGKEACTQFGIE